MCEVRDKVVLVTGGATGIGALVVKDFLNEGAKHVAALDVDVKNGTTLEQELTAKYGADKFEFYKCDVTSGELEVAYESILKKFGYIDVVINNAGLMNDDPKVYLKEITVNVSALITSSLKAYEIMRKDHGGRGGTIINISSIVGLYHASLLPIYAATKSAVLMFSNCLGMKPHYPRSDVRVLTICFGCTDTSLLSETKMAAFDEETSQMLVKSIRELGSTPASLAMQRPESAVKGLMDSYKKGESGSTWLITSDKPAQDITENIKKGFEIMGQGVFP